MRYIHILLVAIIFITSCSKNDKAIVLPPSTGGASMQANMGADYEFQYYINLAEQKIVHTSVINNWDVALQSTTDNIVMLNSGKGMAAYNTHNTNFADVTAADTAKINFGWKYDIACGEKDSTAIGRWENGTASKNEVYIIKLNVAGTQLRKFRIVSADMFQYVIEVGDINSQTPTAITITRTPNNNYTYFSFSFLAKVDGIEPASNDTWDFVCTRYGFAFLDQEPVLHYIVNGCLLNNTNTYGYKDSVTNYNNIDKAFAEKVTLTKKLDVIGFDWKKYDFDKGYYTIVPQYNYIIKDRNNRYFKLRFLDFYSPTGVKGSPKFEFHYLN